MEARKRKRYDTGVIYLYSKGKEHLLPQNFRDNIPAANRCIWRKKDFNSFEGSQFRYLIDALEERQYLRLKNRLLSKRIYGIARLFSSLYPVMKESFLKQFERDDSKRRLVEGILKNKNAVPLKESLRFIGMKPGTFYQYWNDIKFKCNESPLLKCVKKRPQQFSKQELATLERMLRSKKYRCWPIASVCYYASRIGRVHASLSTWYKYCRHLNIRRKRMKKEGKRKGIRADGPNGIWHMDVTKFCLKNNRTYHIYLVIDNYSRKVLAWKIAYRLHMSHSKEVLQQAYKHAVRNSKRLEIQLLVDGGKENHNYMVEDFIESLRGSVKKITALKDIQFSNSRIESYNKLIKYNYLRLLRPPACKAGASLQ